MYETIKSYISAYERRNLEDCIACLAADRNVMAYGTSAEEKRVGLDAVKAQFAEDWAQASSATIEVTWRHEAEHGDMGWVAADLHFRFETPHGTEESAGRATFVMLRGPNGEWLIEHMHFSVPSGFACPT